VRIVAQLVDGDSDRQVWAETYDRKLDDIFAIQTDVALSIASSLEAELSDEEQHRVARQPTDDLQAYQLFLQGRQWFSRYTPDALRRAIELFDRAVARDPAFALAYANAGMAYIELAEGGAMEPDAAFTKAKAAVETSLRLDPELSTPHVTAAYLKMTREFDWPAAEREFRRALELSPSDTDAHDLYGRLCMALGRMDDALALLRRAEELDPLAHTNDITTAMLRAGRFDEALARARQSVETNPTNARTRATLGWANILTGRVRDGVADLERAVALAPGNNLWLAQLGAAYAMAGDTSKARGVLRQLEEKGKLEFVSPYHLAYVHTGLGEYDRAIELLESAVAARTGPTYGIKGSFLFLPLQGQPRFQALLRGMGLG
jgi:serine/threonine-protein kinase